MAATQVQVHIRSTRSPSSSRTTRATAHSADPGEHHAGGVHLQRRRGLLRRSRARCDLRARHVRVGARAPGLGDDHVARCRRSYRPRGGAERSVPAGRPSAPGSPHARQVPSRPGRQPPRPPAAADDAGTPADVVGGDAARRGAATGPQVRPKNGLDRYFEISARRSTVGRELRGGLTTFFTMAYIVVLNPIILSGAGHQREHAARSPRRRRGHRAGRRRHDDPHGRRRPVPVRAGHRPRHQRDRRGLRGHPAVLARDHGPDRARGPADHGAGAHRLPEGGLRGHPAAAEDRDRGRHRLLPDDHRARRRRHHPARAAR